MNEERASIHIVNNAGYERAPVLVAVAFTGVPPPPKVITNNSRTVFGAAANVFPIGVVFQPTSGEAKVVVSIQLPDASHAAATQDGYSVTYDPRTRTLVASNAKPDDQALAIPPGQVPVVAANLALQHVFNGGAVSWEAGPGPVCDFTFTGASGDTVLSLTGVKPGERRETTTKPFVAVAVSTNIVDSETGALIPVNLSVDNIVDTDTGHVADNYPRAPGKKLQLAYYASSDDAMVTSSGKVSDAVVFEGFGTYAYGLNKLPMPVGKDWSAMVVTNATDAPVTVHVVQKHQMTPTRLDPVPRQKFVVRPGGTYPLVVYPGDTRLLFENGGVVAVPNNKFPVYTDTREDYVLPGFEPFTVAQLDSKNNVFYLDLVDASSAEGHVMQMSDTRQFKHTDVYTDAYEARILPKLQASKTAAGVSSTASSPSSSSSSGLDGVSIAMIATAAVAAVGVIAISIAVAKESKALSALRKTFARNTF